MKKTIKLYNNYQNNILNLEDEKQKTVDAINNIYSLNMNENNKNNSDYALDALSDKYKIVPNKYTLVAGSYIRYIDTANYKDMKLRVGGFVLSDNGFSIVYKSNNRCVKLNKKHCIIFVYITYNEQLRCAIKW